MPIILGIDPGLQRTGWAIIEKNRSNQRFTLHASGIITAPARKIRTAAAASSASAANSTATAAPSQPIQNLISLAEYKKQAAAASTAATATADLSRTLAAIFSQLSTIIATYSPDEAAIENTYVNVDFAASLKLAQARAAALIACATAAVKITSYQAKTVKKVVTGSGNADKTQVQRVLPLYLNLDSDLNPKPIQSGQLSKRRSDETDAIAIALCHLLQTAR